MDNLRLPYGQDVQPLYRYPHSGVGNDYRPDVDLSPFSAAPAIDYDDVHYHRTPPYYSRVVGAYDQPPSHFKPGDFLEGQFNNNKSKFIDITFGNHNNHFVSDAVVLVDEPALGFLANTPSYRIYCKAGGERLVVAIRDGKLVLTRPDPTDLTQHWYKDERYSTKVKDKESHPSFILVNKGTAQAIKHSIAGQPLQLVPYKTDEFDVYVLWTESNDLGNGFRTMRKVSNISLVMDAWNGDKDHGGVHDGTHVALYKCWKRDNQNQQWKFVSNYQNQQSKFLSN